MSIYTYNVYCFDIDGTLAGSYDAIDSAVGDMLCSLLQKGKQVVFVSGRRFSSADAIFGDIEHKVIKQLPCFDAYATAVHAIASGGAHMLEYKDGTWRDVFRKGMTDKDIALLIDAYEQALPKALVAGDPALAHKSRHVNKDNLMLSCTSIEPTEVGADRSRDGWDDDYEKRRRIIQEMQVHIPHDRFDIRIGGGTTLDISMKGVNKKTALEAFFVHTGCKKEETVFIGDGFGKGGNDEVVKETGIATVEVRDPDEVLTLFNDFN